MIEIRVDISELARSGKVGFYIRDRDHDRRVTAVPETLVFKEIENVAWTEPTVELDEDSGMVTQLMTDLWNAGIRPSNASSPSETVNAHRDHIDTLKDVNNRLLSIVESETR